MANKKDICKDCKFFNHKYQWCTNDNKKEVIILNRQEQIVNFVPDKDTKCGFYEEIGAE